MKKAIYTCLSQPKENLIPALNFEGWDCFLFTDQNISDSKGWSIIKHDESLFNTVKYKLLIHKYLYDYDIFCFVDQNRQLIKEPPSSPIIGKSSSGKNLFQEAREQIKLNPGESTNINRQMLYYSKHRIKQFPFILDTGFFVRVNSNEINYLHELWWEQIENFSSIDQLSLPFVSIKSNVYPQNIVNYSESKQYFQINELVKILEKTKPSVHHITAGRSDKNIGKAINDIAKMVPDQDWICYRDIDTIPMYHEKFFKQCEEIAEKGDFDLVGCITNRLGLERQLYQKKISDNPDMLYHREIAKELYEANKSKVLKVTQGIAGLMMLFSKEIWQRVGGFEEGYIVHPNGNYFDYEFCQKVKKAKGSIGVAEGIYLFHFYRFESEKPTISTKHLY